MWAGPEGRRVVISRGSRWIAALLVFCAGVTTASAQTTPGRPYRGLFGASAQQDSKQTQTAGVTFSLNEAYDSNIVGNYLGLIREPLFHAGGAYSEANLNVNYRGNWRRLVIASQGGGDFRYSNNSRLNTLTPAASASIQFKPIDGRSATLLLQQSAAYYPYRFLSFFPVLSDNAAADVVTAPGLDFAISTVAGHRYRSDADFDYRMGKASSAILTYSHSVLDYSGRAPGLVEDGAYAGFRHRVTRSATLRLGYGERQASYPGTTIAGITRIHQIDAGVDYNRSLSLTRKTTVTFSSGMAATTPDGNRLAYYVTGTGALDREIGRSWRARILYNRSLQFLEGLTVPFVADAFSTSVGGYMSRRVDVSLVAGVANGTGNSRIRPAQYLTENGSAQMRIALNRYGALSVQYFEYHYKFKDAAQIVGGLPGAMDRRGVRAGLTLWLPLLRE